MKPPIVTKEVLEIYDQYDGDFGLLDERWARASDREKLTSEQMLLFSEYEDKLHLIKCDAYSVQMKEKISKRIAELENVIDPEVVEILKKRILGM